MKQLLIRVAKFLVAVAVLFYLFRWVDFSEKQSALLAVLLYLAYEHFTEPSEEKEKKFVPFSVFVMPHTKTILQDFGLVGDTDQDWEDFWKNNSGFEKKGWSIWQNKGFSFTFVTRGLIYNKDWNMFSSEDIKVGAGLEPATIADNRGSAWAFSPYLTLRLGLDSGLDLHITLVDWYWEKIKDRPILKSIQNEASANPESCTVRVTIARLSPDEFVTYAALEGGYNAVTYQKAVEARKAERSRLGWKGRSSSDTYGRETSEDRSNEAEHRYCTVSHQAI